MLDKQDYKGGMESTPRSNAEESNCRDFARRLEGDEIKGHYIMNEDGSVREGYNLREWAESFEISNRIIQKTKIGKVEVSTVFLGLDHSYGGGPPQLFETMVFGGKLDHETVRYATLEDAKVGHMKMVWQVRARGRNDVRR